MIVKRLDVSRRESDKKLEEQILRLEKLYDCDFVQTNKTKIIYSTHICKVLQAKWMLKRGWSQHQIDTFSYKTCDQRLVKNECIFIFKFT